MTTNTLPSQNINVIKDSKEILRAYAIDVFTRLYCKETVKMMPDKHTGNEDIMANSAQLLKHQKLFLRSWMRK